MIAQTDSFSKIPGVSHTDNALRYFTFTYDVRKCTKRGYKKFLCVFHIVCFNPTKTAGLAPTQYQLHFEEAAAEAVLQEGVVLRDRADTNQTKKYMFSLK